MAAWISNESFSDRHCLTDGQTLLARSLFQLHEHLPSPPPHLSPLLHLPPSKRRVRRFRNRGIRKLAGGTSRLALLPLPPSALRCSGRGLDSGAIPPRRAPSPAFPLRREGTQSRPEFRVARRSAAARRGTTQWTQFVSEARPAARIRPAVFRSAARFAP